MSESITLDKPEQIHAWVLISRRHQLQLQMKGLKTPLLVTWCRENIPGCERARTARDCVVPVEFALSELGVDVDYNLVNVHVLERVASNQFQDLGIFNSPDEAKSPYLVSLFAAGRLEVVLTMDEPREATGEFFTSA